MAFEPPVEHVKGKIREVSLEGGVRIGGESTFPFHLWEGEMPNAPIIAMEVYDESQPEWPDAVRQVYEDVMDDPVAWALKCQDEFGADAVCIQLKSTDPNGADASPESAAETVNKVVGAVKIPVLVYGSGSPDKDADVLKKVAEALPDKSIPLGPVDDSNYRLIGAAAMGYKKPVVAFTSMDVNLAKQLNVLLSQLGVPEEKIIMDPTTGALGYGLEYCYSIMERDRLAALVQNDGMMQMPVINNLAPETWKAKESRVSEDEEPTYGNVGTRGILWEAITATTLLLAGSDILVMRHPEAVKLVRAAMEGLKAQSKEKVAS
ncbi:MAG: acetyl-CoA decarbonylase/synthase complex subunit delta [Thermoleophilia bacterium]|nr:acetyl-CoA decarbonylase/synthase complex subunit delta [Thermoleophilia bacterium]